MAKGKRKSKVNKSKVVRLTPSVYKRLVKLAKPWGDTVAQAVQRLLGDF